MGINFEMKGMDEFKKKMKDLENNPQKLFVGKTLELQKEIECEHCGKDFEATIPIKIEKIVGKTGYGPGVSVKEECPHCGKMNDITWAKTTFDFT